MAACLTPIDQSALRITTEEVIRYCIEYRHLSLFLFIQKPISIPQTLGSPISFGTSCSPLDAFYFVASLIRPKKRNCLFPVTGRKKYKASRSVKTFFFCIFLGGQKCFFFYDWESIGVKKL